MFRKFVILVAALALFLPPVLSNAAEKSATGSKSKVANAKPKITKVKHKTTARKAPSVQDALLDEYDGSGILQLASSKALIVNQETGEILFAKNTNQHTPIASVTKLMTAMVVLDAQLPMEEVLTVSEADIDMLKGTTSRLRIGTALTRGEMLQLALMASENRAASALGRHYPGGISAFIQAMNLKAVELGMFNTQFVDSTGLNSQNVSTAEDLVLMVRAAYEYPEIRQVSTTPSQEVAIYGNRNPMSFVNTNALVRKGDWAIGLSKTGYISEAGRCLVMQAEIGGQPLIIVLLDSIGKQTRIGDANRIRKWIESSYLKSIMG
ncbi:serine-type D-Ala-D-Ala endopeptidase (penicillin-binding protein 7) [Methylophilaceae bacterium]|nr:serine-type D-Ala-D-Ala endopeptidase (penicillin-binding protein 7) [Methylophilaceae bacterium]